jgi:hypothetical protein
MMGTTWMHVRIWWLARKALFYLNRVMNPDLTSYDVRYLCMNDWMDHGDALAKSVDAINAGDDSEEDKGESE